jgi:hypothetical protein
MAGLLQDADHKSESELVAAGGTKAMLLNDTKIYVTANSINKTLDDAIVDGDIGGGGGGGTGGINYITNTDFETDVSGWVTYADVAGTSPVDGTGGSPNVTFTRNTTTPLRGTADGVLTKDAANRQGQGVAYDFTIAKADFATPMTVKFEYIASANFSFANADVTVWVYSKDGTAIIPITPNTLDGSGHFVGQFQTEASPNNDYRLIFHVATTNASAWTLNIDSVTCGPTSYVYGNLQDKQYDISSYVSASYISSGGSWTTNTAYAIPYKSKNGNWRIRYNISGSTTSGATEVDINISGITFIAGSNNYQSGSGGNDSSYTSLSKICPGSDLIQTYAGASSRNWFFYGDANITAMPTWGTDFYPAQLGDGAETRVVAARVGGSVPSTSANQPLIFSSVNYDKTNSYSTSTGKYTVPTVGIYKIYGAIEAASGTAGSQVKFYKNGSFDSVAGGAFSSLDMVVSGSMNCVVGDQIDIRVNQAYAVTSASITFERISGPAFISASESVCATYTNSSGFSVPNNAETVITGWTKVYDSHGTFNTNGIYTIPSNGKYRFNGLITFNNATITAGTEYYLYVQQAGSATTQSKLCVLFPTNTATNYVTINGCATHQCVAGDTISIGAYHNAGSARSLYNNASWNYINIEKVAN